MNDERTREAVRERYAEAARRAAAGQGQVEKEARGQEMPRTESKGCCCSSPAALPGTTGTRGPVSGCDPVTADLYRPGETDGLPEGAKAASLGCGNPTALAELKEGETVLDLGSGGGIDVLLSARRVGPTGKVYGLDMTDEMLELARKNQREAGVTNVEFLKGEIERIPLPDESVDVIISNCVINLSTDKGRVLKEAFRVLRKGGRFAVSDVVVRGPVPEEIRRSVELWVGCIAGALEEKEYRRLLAEAGFTGVEVEPWRIYGAEDVRALQDLGGGCCGGPSPESLAKAEGAFMSAFVRAAKPR